MNKNSFPITEFKKISASFQKIYWKEISKKELLYLPRKISWNYSKIVTRSETILKIKKMLVQPFIAQWPEIIWFLKSFEQFTWIVKGQYNFWNRMFSNLLRNIEKNIGDLEIYRKSLKKLLLVKLCFDSSLNTQSCIRRPLCSTLKFENLSISLFKIHNCFLKIFFFLILTSFYATF